MNDNIDKKNPKVSVIVPVYNAGKHLYKCLDTLVNQSLSDIEIILVLDCPTDRSDDVAKSYEKQYNNIKILSNQENLNVGLSRNNGLFHSTGEYVSFADHDDYRQLDMYEEMYTIAKRENADVLFTKEFNVRDSETVSPDLTNSADVKIETGEEFAKKCFISLLSNSQTLPIGVVHTHIYKREFLMQNNIQFVDAKRFAFDDNIFNLQVYDCILKNKGSIYYLPKKYYCYVSHNNNTGNTFAYRKLNNCLNALEEIAKFPERKNDYFPANVLHSAYRQRCVRNLYSSWRYELKKSKIMAFKNLSIIKNYPAVCHFLKIRDKNNGSSIGQLSFSKKCFQRLLRYFYI